MDYGDLVNRTTIACGRLECDVTSRILRELVEPISKSADYAEHVNLSRSCKPDLECYIALNFKPPRLFGIPGIGLGQQHQRCCMGLFLRFGGGGGCLAESSAAEATLCHATGASRSSCSADDAIRESC